MNEVGTENVKEAKEDTEKSEEQRRAEGVARWRRGERRCIFWNVAGMWNKDSNFWQYIEEFDLVNLTETWLEQKGWEILKERLAKTHVWKCKWATGEKGKGRAKGGFITGKRKSWGERS